MNYAIILANVIVFVLTYGPHRFIHAGMVVESPLRPWAGTLMLIPVEWHWYQFITYAFLHGGLLHILGNMYFLYIFGNNVCDKLGSARYLLFYLVSCVASSAGYIAISKFVYPEGLSAPMLGASGAVSAVTGAYLVLFPQTLLTIFYWFFFIGTVEVPAMYFIAFKMILIDNIMIRYTPGIAYEAHIAGYAFGIAVIFLLLATGLVKSGSYDLLAMINQWNRRRRYRDIVAEGYDPFTGRAAARKKINAREVEKDNTNLQSDQKVLQLRSEINSRIVEKNLPDAAALYLELDKLDTKQPLPRQHLLDIANQLASEKKYEQAAKAYEKFIRLYPNYEYIEQVQLMLGLIYSRYLSQNESAVHHLEKALEKLTDPAQKKMCQDELEKLSS